MGPEPMMRILWTSLRLGIHATPDDGPDRDFGESGERPDDFTEFTAIPVWESVNISVPPGPWGTAPLSIAPSCTGRPSARTGRRSGRSPTGPGWPRGGTAS